MAGCTAAVAGRREPAGTAVDMVAAVGTAVDCRESVVDTVNRAAAVDTVDIVPIAHMAEEQAYLYWHREAYRSLRKI